MDQHYNSALITMNWTWLIGVVVAVVGGAYLLAQSAGPNANDGEYRRHLTTSEKVALGQGRIITKEHKAYNDIWKTGFSRGPLKVEPLASGKLKFTGYGHWEQFKKGILIADWDIASGHNSIIRTYDASGAVTDLIIQKPILINGDSATETRVIYLRFPALKDTLAVEHWFLNFDNKRVRKDYWSFDAQGKRLVPEGWKFERYPHSAQ